MKDPDIDNAHQYKDHVAYEEYKNLLLNDSTGSSNDKSYDITYYYDRRDEEDEDPEDDEAYWGK